MVMDKEELLFKKRIQDLTRQAYQRNIVTFTDFLDLHELHILNSLNMREVGVRCRLFGGYELAERQMAAFYPDALSCYGEEIQGNELFGGWSYPISCMEITPIASKFAEVLNHRDYLGALLHLGIDRGVLGDILIKDSTAYVFCLSHMEEFIQDNCTRIRHTAVIIKPVSMLDQVITSDFEEVTGTVASVRLDSVIGVAFHTSRSSMIGLIEGGKVHVNGKMITSNGYHLKEKDIISVRGYGKFQFDSILSETKKGRSRILVRRYC